MEGEGLREDHSSIGGPATGTFEAERCTFCLSHQGFQDSHWGDQKDEGSNEGAWRPQAQATLLVMCTQARSPDFFLIAAL